MSRVLSVGISPCPNDTFVWGGLALGQVRTPFRLLFFYEDIQALNLAAQEGRFDVVKVSFFQYALLPRRRYRLLSVGAALGYGIGPLLVAKSPLSPAELREGPVGVPGFGTTAYSLFRFYAPEVEKVIELRYDQLMPAVARGDLRAAVIIHESRFTYAQHGLVCLQDLGAYWTEKTGYPIPLGCLAVKRTVPRRPLERALRRSLRLAWQGSVLELPAFVAAHAQELDPEVQQAHIRLYVNRYTRSLRGEGWVAVRYYLQWVRRHRSLFPFA